MEKSGKKVDAVSREREATSRMPCCHSKLSNMHTVSSKPTFFFACSARLKPYASFTKRDQIDVRYRRLKTGYFELTFDFKGLHDLSLSVFKKERVGGLFLVKCASMT